MATISIVIADLPGGVPDVPTGWTLSPTDAGRMLAYLSAQYGIDDEGNPRQPTDIVKAAGQKIIDGVLANVERYERDTGYAQVDASITPLVATMQE